jgi:TPP-dependent pyruvate/acetoin dehydrogenase alpha subunit
LQGEDRVTVCFFGDGALAEGKFHESLNLAALWKLPVLFVLENNLYAMGIAVARVQANTDFTIRAAGYGLPAEAVDGNDVVAVKATARRLVDAIRAGSGPQFLECQTYRIRPHSMFDAEKYRDKAEVAEWRKKSTITRFQNWLLDNNLMHQTEVDSI